jgi:uncharacterized protein (DUF1330 family)
MAAYVLASIQVHNPEEYEDYKKLSGPSLEAFGGRFLVRGGAVTSLEGEWAPRRLIILEFDSMEKARAWYGSEEYGRAMAIRKRTAATDMIVVEGI